MSRHDSDLDYYEWLNGPDADPHTAICDDCGTAYARAEDDPTTCCDACSDRRDRWVEALEARRLAKAALTMTRIKERA